MKYQNYILSALIALTSVLGDRLVFHSPYSDSYVFRGIIDNLVHSAIGLLSSLLFLTYDPSHTARVIALNAVVCTAVSTLIDVDHVIVAKSVYWKDLKNFKHRGIFHCSSVWFAASLTVIAISHVYRKLNYNILGWMLLTAFTSHHIRDAHRRGLWLWPLGHTRGVDQRVYVLLVTVLPSVYYVLYRGMKPGLIGYAPADYQYHVV